MVNEPITTSSVIRVDDLVYGFVWGTIFLALPLLYPSLPKSTNKTLLKLSKTAEQFKNIDESFSKMSNGKDDTTEDITEPIPDLSKMEPLGTCQFSQNQHAPPRSFEALSGLKSMFWIADGFRLFLSEY